MVKVVDSNREQLILSEIWMWYDFSDRYDFANFPLLYHHQNPYSISSVGDYYGYTVFDQDYVFQDI